MPQLAQAIAAVSEASERLQEAERLHEQERVAFAEALRAAHKAGASYGLLGRLVGLSRQRVATIISRG